MGTDFSSIDASFGFQPYGNVLRAQLYAVATAPTIAIYTNDIVIHGGTGASTPIGYLPIIEDAQAADSYAFILGSVLECFDENMMPVSYIAALEAGNSTIAGYVLVADHPNQLFIAQEDGGANAITASEMGFNIDLISTNAGNTYTGIGGQELDSDSAGAAAALQFKLIRPHEDDTIDVDATPYNRWIVQVNEHFYHDVVGIGI